MTGSTHYEMMSEVALDEARFDQPALAGPRAGRSYVICTTPRSGSWLLCRQLINAGIGVPSEYLGIHHVNALYSRFAVDPRDMRAYLRALVARRTTPNGVFGTKLLWSQFADHRPALRITLLQNARLIYLSRRDLAPQVVSLHLAIVTGRWGFDATTVAIRRGDVEIGDLTHLAECEAMILQQQRAWRDLFAGLRAAPTELVYEDVVADQAGAVVRIAQALGLAAHEYRVPPPEPRETPYSPDIEAQRHRLVAAWRAQRAA